MRQAAVASEYARQLRQLVFHAMHGGQLQEESLLAAIKNSGFPFDAHRPVRMGYGMFGAAMRPELLHQSMNLIEELMRPMCRCC